MSKIELMVDELCLRGWYSLIAELREKGDIRMSVLTKTEAKEATTAEAVRGREVVLSVLERAAEESDFLARLADNPSEALAEYSTLTSKEHAALASGDVKKMEEGVGKLDDRLATWLWCRLSQEKW